MPVRSPRFEAAANRPIVPAGAIARPFVRGSKSDWTLLATLHGAVIHDISFPSSKVGYAAAELGQVWKTSDGGKTWSEIMNLGFPYEGFGGISVNAIGRSHQSCLRQRNCSALGGGGTPVRSTSRYAAQ